MEVLAVADEVALASRAAVPEVAAVEVDSVEEDLAAGEEAVEAVLHGVDVAASVASLVAAATGVAAEVVAGVGEATERMRFTDHENQHLFQRRATLPRGKDRSCIWVWTG